MIKVMFICHGNICRSPMAEFVFRDMVRREGLSDKILVASSATSREEIGTPVYPPARAILAEHGLSCKGKTAVQLTKSDYDEFDYLVPMEDYNIRNMCRIIGADTQSKVRKLLDYTNQGGDVADPWYSGDFETCYRDIFNGCTGLLEYIKNHNL